MEIASSTGILAGDFSAPVLLHPGLYWLSAIFEADPSVRVVTTGLPNILGIATSGEPLLGYSDAGTYASGLDSGSTLYVNNSAALVSTALPAILVELIPAFDSAAH